MSSDLELWRRLLNGIETEAPPALEVAERLAETLDIDVADAQTQVYDAIDEGILVEDGEGFGSIRLADEDTDVSRKTTEQSFEDLNDAAVSDGQEIPEPGSDTWKKAVFDAPESRVWAPAQIKRDAWMCRSDTKAPFSPWTDADAPVECNHSDHDEVTTCDECSHSAGYKWGSNGSRQHVHAAHDTALEWADKHPTLSSDLVYIQRESDPFAFVDGDNVLDPETGEIHPGFLAILEHLGVTYADISTSRSGVHAVYRGELPLDGVQQATFDIDTEPFGSNDDAPAIEIYANKHVCIATGEHVPGAGTEVTQWDSDTLRAILRANGFDDKPEPSANTDLNLDDHDPTATEANETTDDIKDLFYALDRLDAWRVAADTIVHSWNESADTSGENRAFAPTWGTSANGTANIVNREIWQDTGGKGYGGADVIAAIDCPDLPGYDERTQPRDLTGADWFRAVTHLRDLGYAIPELEDSREEYDDDPRDADIVLNPRRAWEAAGRVTPDELDSELALTTTDDGEAWIADGQPVDVVRAVAVTEFDHNATEMLDSDAYDRAYRYAREAYGSPLPEYVTEADAADRYDVVIGAVQALDFFDLNTEALTAEVTAADDVMHYIDPTPVEGWRNSESGESVLVFDSGTVYDADTEQTIDALRVVALDSGLIDSPAEPLEGDLFERAYRIAREEYNAPLPRWAIGTPEVEPVLPPAEDLVETVPDTDDELQEARDDVEALYRRLARGEGDTDVSVLRALPGLGKTTSAIKSAVEVPTTYLAPRKELQKDAASKAGAWGASYQYLPVFGGSNIPDVTVEKAVDAVRESDKGLLRDRWALANEVNEPLDPAEDSEDDSDDDSDEDSKERSEEDSVDLDRPTCPCAGGEHGDAWALVVHTARGLDYTPRDIHERAEALFGSTLPCQDSGESDDCPYSAGWDRVADPDQPIDLLIGSYVHAHVESARTHYSRDGRGHIDRTERTVVLDEFIGDVFTEEFGEEFIDIALWLASALRADVVDRQDLFNADLWDDDWVRAWLRGDAVDDGPAENTHSALHALADLAEAVRSAEDLLDGYGEFVDQYEFRDSLEALRDTGTDIDTKKARRIAAELRERTEEVNGQRGGSLVRWVTEDIIAPLEAYDGAEPVEALPDTVAGDLLAFVEDATEAAHERREGAAGLLRAAATAIEGGEEGCRELAVHADHGFANRLAHQLLAGVAAPAGEDDVADVIETNAFDYFPGAFDGTRLKHVRLDAAAGTDTVLVDRNHEGATVLSPPSRTAGNGEESPFVGLDATARQRLWGLMLSSEVGIADIHDSMADRARFLQDGLGLQVIRTATKNRFYEGDPSGKDLDGDVALIEEINDEYTGVYGGDRGEDAATVGSPAVITTKGVRGVLENDNRLNGKVAAWDNYGNITGDNALGEHQLAAVLGCQHFGDHAVEKVAALAGEEVTRTGKGRALSYDSPVADTYLKHMTEDQTMQAILRFTRGDSGAVVFARTAALREDLPVVGEGQVVRSWSSTAVKVARAWKAKRGERFTVADVAEAVDVSRRQVRRVLDEFASAGHLEKHETGVGRANEFTPGLDPGAGQVELPNTELDPDTSRKGTIYTGNVRVWSLEDGERQPPRTTRSTLPAPEEETGGAAPG